MNLVSALVHISIPNNATWQDAFQFGDPDDDSWNLAGQSFRADIKGSKEDAVPLLTCSTASGTIIVDNTDLRVIHFNVPDTALAAAGLIPGDYVYDLVMYDAATPPVRTLLMSGRLRVSKGVTGD